MPGADRASSGRYTRVGKTLADDIRRFVSKCRFDATTGCVLWVAGKTRGRGKTAWYGSFKYQGKRWSAHRWAAKYILGLEIDDLDVDHKCNNTLCQLHLQAVTKDVNSAYYWIRVEKGVFDLPEPDAIDDDGIPYYWPPAWFAQFTDRSGQDSP